MRYILKKGYTAIYPEVDLEKNKYESLKEARKIISNGLSIEENYEILILNYPDFENEILSYSAQSMVRSRRNYGDFFQVKMNMNRRLVNLLTAAKLYLDQLFHHIAVKDHGKQALKIHIKNECSAEYKINLEYRFMEALRNYVQHRGLPVHYIQFRSQIGQSSKYSVQILLQKSWLYKDEKFKQSILDEIPDELDLIYATRGYIESISRIHITARGLMKELIDNARLKIAGAFELYKEAFPDETEYLILTSLDEQEKPIESLTLILSWDDIRMQLVERNENLFNLRNRFVSNETSGEGG